MMYSKTLITILTMAGLFVDVTYAGLRISSANGVSYNCPDQETIEVAYANSCKSYKPVEVR